MSFASPATGALAYQAGLSAEAQVAADYAARGYRPLATRWRGRCGEIDLVLADGAGLVFVEVKKSRSFDAPNSSSPSNTMEPETIRQPARV